MLLWKKTKADLVQEMDSAVQMPGWGNIWTQPIVNRIDMLATGVRTMIGVKVFGNDLDKIQKVSEEVAAVLRQIPGAVDVFPDQNVGKGYLEIQIDRQKAARYGVNVGDIQDVVEVALGGKAITSTVEGASDSRPHSLRPGVARRRGAGEKPAGQRGRRRHEAPARWTVRPAGPACRPARLPVPLRNPAPRPCRSRYPWSPTCGSSKAPP